MSRRPKILHGYELGRGMCRWCGKSILHPAEHKHAGSPNMGRTWHPGCVEEYRAQEPAAQRQFLHERDKGICARCGLNTDELLQRATRASRDEAKAHSGYGGGNPDRGAGAKILEQAGFNPQVLGRRYDLWDADHIVELQDGGKNHTDNMQILCIPCHKVKTNEERARRREPSSPKRRRKIRLKS